MKKIICILITVLCINACTSDKKATPKTPIKVVTKEKNVANKVVVSDRPSKEESTLSLVNEYRSQGCKCGGQYMPPVPPLRWNAKLENAAHAHSADMYRNNLFSHQGSDGSDASTRVSNAGYRWMAIAENIAQGQRSEAEAIRSWIQSPGHCRNIMNPRYREMGLASVQDYWTQAFGSEQ